MPIEKKAGLFYELMIRGNWHPKNGPLGAIMTYQLQTGTALVDTEKNELAAPYAPDPAKDLSKEQAIEFLGERFGNFVGQLATERAAADEQIEAAKVGAQKVIDDARVAVDALLAEAAAKLAASEAEVLRLKNSLAALTSNIEAIHTDAKKAAG